MYPPTCPLGFDPINHTFSKVKGLLGRAEARARGTMIGAMDQALEAVTVHDVARFFRLRGHRTVDQPGCGGAIRVLATEAHGACTFMCFREGVIR